VRVRAGESADAGEILRASARAGTGTHAHVPTHVRHAVASLFHLYLQSGFPADVEVDFSLPALHEFAHDCRRMVGGYANFLGVPKEYA
jgi:hypothetical protein